MIGILGFAQTGKDTVAHILNNHGYQRMAMADPLKRMVMELFDFSFGQMWGTLTQKELPDLRYPRPRHEWNRSMVLPYDESDADIKCQCCGETMGVWQQTRSTCFLTPRYAMKIIGTEGARHCYNPIWVERAIKDAKLVESGGYAYSQVEGLTRPMALPTFVMGGKDIPLPDVAPPKIVVFTDCRFENEVEGILAAGGQVYRIRRPGFEKPMFDHPSETEQLRIPDDRLTGVIHNDGTLADLERKLMEMVRR